MKREDILNLIDKAKKEMAMLRHGCITIKTINGVERYYHQYYEDGKRIYKYVDEVDAAIIKSEIEKYNELKKRIKRLDSELTKPVFVNKEIDDYYECNVIKSDMLDLFTMPIKDLKKRIAYDDISKYIYGKYDSKILILYGLRRTGKTTLLRQIIHNMNEENKGKSCYIKMRKGDTMAMLQSDMNKLSQNGIKYFFIDEITLVEDFSYSASMFSDIYAAMGYKVVLSGTDSMGFYFASRDELYDRTIKIHTTHIPFYEFSYLLNIDSIDKYIEYGGTLRKSEDDFDNDEELNLEQCFYDDESTRKYIDIAICKNIQNSLEKYENTNYSNLLSLYECGELTGIINRIIEDLNHRFVLRVLEKDFKSNDLKISQRNLRLDRNKEERTFALDLINEEGVISKLKEFLEIKNKKEFEKDVDEKHLNELYKYLKELDLISEIDIINYDYKLPSSKRVIFTQPGMRYAQAKALVKSLLKDEFFSSLSEREKDYIIKRIDSEIKGRMLEDIILFETKNILPKDNYDVFKLTFDIGEYDMVIFDKYDFTVSIYEIKHSDKIDENQYRFLTDEKKNEYVTLKYGDIVKKCVLYRGEDALISGISYKNAEKYLKEISKFKQR